MLPASALVAAQAPLTSPCPVVIYISATWWHARQPRRRCLRAHGHAAGDRRGSGLANAGGCDGFPGRWVRQVHYTQAVVMCLHCNEAATGRSCRDLPCPFCCPGPQTLAVCRRHPRRRRGRAPDRTANGCAVVMQAVTCVSCCHVICRGVLEGYVALLCHCPGPALHRCGLCCTHACCQWPECAVLPAVLHHTVMLGAAALCGTSVVGSGGLLSGQGLCAVARVSAVF